MYEYSNKVSMYVYIYIYILTLLLYSQRAEKVYLSYLTYFLSISRLANKQDKVTAMVGSELIEILSLEQLVNKSRCLCHIVSSKTTSLLSSRSAYAESYSFTGMNKKYYICLLLMALMSLFRIIKPVTQYLHIL